jgi:hypothetical protein
MLSFVLLPLIVPHIITAIALYFASVPLGLALDRHRPLGGGGADRRADPDVGR